MKLENKNLIVKRAYKEVYKTEEGIVKIFEKTHPKADVFNEALNTARVEAAGLRIPGAVSYTHLDVYKRQAIQSFTWTMEESFHNVFEKFP